MLSCVQVHVDTLEAALLSPKEMGVYLCHYITPEGYFCNEAGAATVTPTS